jgi:hypothetical protein
VNHNSCRFAALCGFASATSTPKRARFPAAPQENMQFRGHFCPPNRPSWARATGRHATTEDIGRASTAPGRAESGTGSNFERIAGETLPPARSAVGSPRHARKTVRQFTRKLHLRPRAAHPWTLRPPRCCPNRSSNQCSPNPLRCRRLAPLLRSERHPLPPRFSTNLTASPPLLDQAVWRRRQRIQMDARKRLLH